MKVRLRPPLRIGLEFALLAAMLALGGCRKAKGVYADQTGTIKLEVGSDDKATFTFGGDAHACTYELNDNKLALYCDAVREPNLGPEKMVLTLHEDGSLTGSDLPVALRKKEE